MSKRDPESSLELLLDAMCNTFGGVMFIAISLVVVMSMLSHISAELPDPEKLRRELEKQQQELVRLRRTAAEQQRMAEILKQDPRMKQAAELAELVSRKNQLATELARQETRLRSENRILQAERTEAARLRKETDRLQKQLQNTAEAIQRERNQIEIQNTRLAAVSAAAPLQFRIQERSRQHPYFFILCNNRAWRVGPELQGRNMLPAADCTFKKDAPEPDGSCAVHCRVIPERGVPICNPDGLLSPEFLQQLSAVPENRVPYFKLDRASLKSFCSLREYLKKTSRLHGVSPALTDGETFDYRETSRKAEYYY